LDWTDASWAVQDRTNTHFPDRTLTYHPALFPLGAAPVSQKARASPHAKPVWRRDPYTISEDGHFIGHDGFVVPRSFEEFFERHPRYVRGRARLCWPNGTDSEREDHESELLIFLMSLPDNSKFRALGYNGFPDGCKDRIQTFNPDLAYGASEPRFFNYVKIILTNHLISLWQKAASNPVRASKTSSFYSPEPDGTLLDEDYIYALASERGAFGMSYDQAIENGILVDEFLRFVQNHNPELLEIIRAIQTSDTYVEAQHTLGITERLFIRARSRLMVLYSCFDKGTDPPHQRKVYRSRTPRTKG
jgi:hypothetical protein